MDANAVVDALGAGIEARDIGKIRPLYADDIAVWHGATGVAQTKEENLALLAKVFEVTSTLGYRDVRRHAIEGGCVQQHRLAGTFVDGEQLPDFHACLIFKVKDGKITHIDEYFDSAAFAAMADRLAKLDAA